MSEDKPNIDALEERTLELLVRQTMTDEDMIRQVLGLLKGHWKTFSTIAASKSGRYHPEVCNKIPYGLVNHTMRVVWLVRELHTEEYTREATQDIRYNQLVAAAWIHDIGKCAQYYEEYKVKVDHSVIGVKWAQEMGCDSVICALIRTHMHGWDNHSYHELHDGSRILARILAYADYLASRKELDFPTLGTFDELKMNVVKYGKLESE